MAQQIIEHDNWFICERLKEIDLSYYIIKNTKTNKYEVHSNNQPLCSYCFGVPYKNLDARTLELALKTQVKNKKKLLQEIDKNNRKYENKIQAQGEKL